MTILENVFHKHPSFLRKKTAYFVYDQYYVFFFYIFFPVSYITLIFGVDIPIYL
jgi:hypothetical protein